MRLSNWNIHVSNCTKYHLRGDYFLFAISICTVSRLMEMHPVSLNRTSYPHAEVCAACFSPVFGCPVCKKNNVTDFNCLLRSQLMTSSSDAVPQAPCWSQRVFFRQRKTNKSNSEYKGRTKETIKMMLQNAVPAITEAGECRSRAPLKK